MTPDLTIQQQAICDMAILRIKVEKTYQALGARKTPIALRELRPALRQRVTDGAAGLPDVFVNFSMCDAAKYLVLTGHRPYVSALMGSHER
jgi:TRAP-type C4-dicarboxylate transport system substrate-binding protein